MLKHNCQRSNLPGGEQFLKRYPNEMKTNGEGVRTSNDTFSKNYFFKIIVKTTYAFNILKTQLT